MTFSKPLLIHFLVLVSIKFCLASSDNMDQAPEEDADAAESADDQQGEKIPDELDEKADGQEEIIDFE